MRALLSVILFLLINGLAAQTAFPFNSVHSSTKKPLKIHVNNELGEKSFLSSHMPKGKIYLVVYGQPGVALAVANSMHCRKSIAIGLRIMILSLSPFQ